jgi:3-oxoacyl-[acyl-carrier protein] reductase
MDLGIRGRTAIVTAGSKGLGLAAAVALAADGANIVLSARGAEALDAAERRLRGAGADVLALRGDVTDPSEPERLVAAAQQRFGGVDILVANSGGPPAARALDVTDEQILAAVNGNLLTSVRLVRAVAGHMRASGWGRICCITSYSVHQPLPGLALSNTARAGLMAWAKTAATDLFDDGITLNLICPGHHATDRMKELGGSGPMGDPADFGRAVAFLCSASAAFITGTTLTVDGGATLGI